MADDTKTRRRLLARVEERSGGCWLWTGPVRPTGYGVFSYNGQSGYAHRAAHEMFVGPIPVGMTVDHICHNRATNCAGGTTCLHRRCVNPAHLTVATHARNVTGSALTNASLNLSKTHCAQGHPFDETNTYTTPKGWRQCRICNRENDHRRRVRERLATRGVTI